MENHTRIPVAALLLFGFAAAAIFFMVPHTGINLEVTFGSSNAAVKFPSMQMGINPTKTSDLVFQILFGNFHRFQILQDAVSDKPKAEDVAGEAAGTSDQKELLKPGRLRQELRVAGSPLFKSLPVRMKREIEDEDEDENGEYEKDDNLVTSLWDKLMYIVRLDFVREL